MGLAAGVLWVMSGGALQALIWFVPHGTLLRAVLPATMPGATWMWPAAWALAAVGAGAFWGVLYGWVAALVRGSSAAPLGSGSPPAALGTPNGLRLPELKNRIVSIGVAVVLVLVYLTASVAGGIAFHTAQQAEVVAAEAAAAEEAGIPRTGAIPDSEAEGDSVPAAAAPVANRDPAWCARDAITLMLPGADAATGHRMATLMAVNVSEAACVLEGYPDIAFGNQNGHLLDVTVEQGSSFMVQDPGVTPVTLQPAEMHAAPVAGDARDTWPTTRCRLASSRAAPLQ